MFYPSGRGVRVQYISTPQKRKLRARSFMFSPSVAGAPFERGDRSRTKWALLND